MRMQNISSFIFGITCSQFIALFISHLILTSSDEEMSIAIFYSPAHTVSIIALFIGGFLASWGIALGSLLWNILYTPLSLASSEIFFIVNLFCNFFVFWFYSTFYKAMHDNEWQGISLQDFLVFNFLYCLSNALFTEMILLKIPEIDPLSLWKLFLMFFNNFLVSSTVFILLNLAMSFFITLHKRLNVP